MGFSSDFAISLEGQCPGRGFIEFEREVFCGEKSLESCLLKRE